MKLFAGLLAVGFFCLAVPHSARADLNCVPVPPGVGWFECTETDQGEASYYWSSNPSGGAVQASSSEFMTTLLASGINTNQWMQEHPEYAQRWFSFFVCRFRRPDGGALPIETISVEVIYGLPGDSRNHTDTAQVNCAAAQSRQEVADQLAMEWAYNLVYWWALVTGGQGYYPSTCYYFAMPFDCMPGTYFDDYGISMWMYGWANEPYWN